MEQKTNFYTTYLVPIFAWILLFSYLFFIPKIIVYSIEEDGRPIQTNINITNIAPKNDSRFNIERLTKQINSNYLFKIYGWAFTTIRPEEPTDIFETEIVFFNKSKNFVFKTDPIARLGVRETFKELGLNIVNPGFSGYINKFSLDYGKYCIGIMLSNQEDNSSIFIITNKTATITPLTLDISLDVDKDRICEDILN